LQRFYKMFLQILKIICIIDVLSVSSFVTSGYRLDGPVFGSRRRQETFYYLKLPRLFLSPTPPPFIYYVQGVRRPGCEVNHSLPLIPRLRISGALPPQSYIYMYLYSVDRGNFTFTFTFSFKTKNCSHCFRTVLSPPHPQPPQLTMNGDDVSTNACPPPDYTMVGSAPKTKEVLLYAKNAMTFLCILTRQSDETRFFILLFN
jgi:hypothetical protein